MPIRPPEFSIILAAGKGTRMRSASRNKVCFPLAGKPAINRAIERYTAAGIRRHVVVVGSLAGQVMETVGAEFDNVSFVYQADQLGTAHATRLGLNALDALGSDHTVLVVAGDRLIEASVLEQLFDVFHAGHCDLALLATPRREGSNQGRIVTSDAGTPLAIIEAADIRQRRLYRSLRDQALAGRSPSAEDLLRQMREAFADANGQVSDKKLAAAFPVLWEKAAIARQNPAAGDILEWISEAMTRFEFIDGDASVLRKTPDEVEGCALVNNSVYLVRASALRYALDHLSRNNAQQEEYLSDMVAVLSSAHEGRRFRVHSVRVTNPHYILGFNDPAELLEAETYLLSVQNRQATVELPISPWHRPIREWQAAMAAMTARGRAGDPALWDEMTLLYGDDPQLLKDQIGACGIVLRSAADALGPDASVLIVRSPGRVNVMGRHIDHQGGNCNLMTIGFETLMVVSPRQDDTIRLFSCDPAHFAQREFSISQLVADLPWDDWLSLVNSDKVSAMVRTYGGDWSQYVRAAVLRLQKKYPSRRLRGMDIVVAGNIPMAAGLSSSSSLVVGAAEATIAVSQLDTFPSQLVDLCGEGEWFVGTRGGSADHAAVKFGQKGKVIKVGFLDFEILEAVSFPNDYVMVVCDSGISAKKNANARDLFNHRIACYRIGFHCIRKAFPQHAPLLRHLRDVNVRTLGFPLSWIYRLLLHLPEQVTRDELRELLPSDVLDPLFATHQPPADGYYPIRGVVLFGLAEMERARLYADCLKAMRLDEIGRLMRISHDGDRAASFDQDGTEHPFKAPTSNAAMLNLIEDLESGDPERVIRAQLQWQPGSYRCSLPAIDKMVDLSLRIPGVAGAQLAGAGLGGCMMVLIRRDAVPALTETLIRNYYEPAGRNPSILVCNPIAGSSVLMMR